jgi:AcrR family transcriptional regulator
MGTVERREREREEVRRKILDAARDLFASEGYDKVTMRRIAEAIEYSPTTIYNHFEDKDDLVRALCEEDFARLFAALSPALVSAADPLETIRQLGRAYCAFGLEHPNHYRFMFMTPDKADEPDETSPGRRSFGLLLQAVSIAMDSGRLRREDPDLVAQVLWSSIHGAVALLITLKPQHWPTPASPRLVEETVENSLRGFLAGGR